MIIGLLGDDILEQVVVSSCILQLMMRLRSNTSEGDCSKGETEWNTSFHSLHCYRKINIRFNVNQLVLLKTRLIRLAEVLEEIYPGSLLDELVPSPMGIDMNKLTKGRVITTDTYNTTQKLRQVLVTNDQSCHRWRR